MPEGSQIYSEEALAEALSNALNHGGRASEGAVLGRLIARHPELRPRIALLASEATKAVQRVNKMTTEEQAKVLSSISVKPLEPKHKDTGTRALPEIPGRPSEVVTRFAPNPDGPLHLGNLRAAVLSHEYARKYAGRFILRFEDTDPRTKTPMKEAYEWIKEDLDWLGIKWDEFHFQSDRFDIYYGYARRLIELNGAYVCSCSKEKFLIYKETKRACPHRIRKDSGEIFEKMVSGDIGEGDAVVRLTTSMSDPNPALRDPPLLRVIDSRAHPHPRLGSKYSVFPLYNFSAAVDDSLMGITLIFRGKEHQVNSIIQTSIQKKLNLTIPVSVQYGRLKLEGLILSKSKIRKALTSGEFSDGLSGNHMGWDDPRLGTVMALRRRGFDPRTFIELMIEVGPKPTEATISWDNLAGINRRFIEPLAKRFFAVFEPSVLRVTNVSGPGITARVPIHPSKPDLGSRIIEISADSGQIDVHVASSDVGLIKERELFRLMDLMNARYTGADGYAQTARYEKGSPSEVKAAGGPIIQWVSATNSVKAVLYKAEGTALRTLEGMAEKALAEEAVGAEVQLVRLGYARIDSNSEGKVTLVYTHD